jgi:hypothetical protein
MKIKELFESATDDLENLEHQVDEALKAGEILNPEYETLKNKINRGIAREIKPIYDEHLVGKADEHTEAAKTDPGVWDLIYGIPESMMQVLALKNKLARVKNKEYKAYKDLKAYYDKRVGIAEKMKKLKGMVVKVTEKRARDKVEKEVVLQKKFTDSKSMVEVLKQHLDEYVKRAGEMAGEQVDRAMKVLRDAGTTLIRQHPALSQNHLAQRMRSPLSAEGS